MSTGDFLGQPYNMTGTIEAGAGSFPQPRWQARPGGPRDVSLLSQRPNTDQNYIINVPEDLSPEAEDTGR